MATQHLFKFLNQGAQPLLRHVGYQVIEHAPLAEQGVRAFLDRVVLEHAVVADALF